MKNTILITGASGGIGKQFALVCAEAKNDVLLVARSDDKLKALCDQIKTRYQVEADYLVADLSVQGSAKKLYQEVIRKGYQITHLINNAGFGDYGNFVDRTLEKAQGMVQLNITSLMDLTWLFARDMVKAGQGRILNVGSTAAMQPDPYLAVYGATKAFVVSFTEAVAYELKGTGVTATVLSPGATESEFFNEADMTGSKMGSAKFMPAYDVAKVGYDAMMKGKLHVFAGLMNKVLGFFSSIMPSSWLKLRVSAAVLGKK